MTKGLALALFGLLLFGFTTLAYAQVPDIGPSGCVGGPGPNGQFLTAEQGGCCNPPSTECCRYAATKNTNWCPTRGQPPAPPDNPPAAPPSGGNLPVVYPPSMYYNTHDVALREFERWGKGTRLEIEQKMAPVVGGYFDAGKCPDSSPTAVPWSAAFISYVMRASGIPFPANCSHVGYFKAVQEGTGPCKTYPMEDINDIDVGDVLCRCTAKDCSLDYDALPDYASAHCEVVTARNGNMIDEVGGNEARAGCKLPACDPNKDGSTVNKRTRDITKLDNTYFGFISCAGQGKPLPPEPPPFCPASLGLALGALLVVVIKRGS